MPVATTHPFLQQLSELHRTTIFPKLFENIDWDSVSSFESHIRREEGMLHLDSTTFWMSASRRTDNASVILFDSTSRTSLGSELSSADLTSLVQHDSDLNIVLGVATHQAQAERAIKRGSVGQLFERFRRASGISKKKRIA